MVGSLDYLQRHLLVESGFDVQLFESRRNCGGRAASFEDPQDGSLVDACQHVTMAVALNFLDLSQRAGFGSQLRRDRTLWFIGPDGARSACTPAGWLPAPLHLVPLLFGDVSTPYLGKIITCLRYDATGGVKNLQQMTQNYSSDVASISAAGASHSAILAACD